MEVWGSRRGGFLRSRDGGQVLTGWVLMCLGRMRGGVGEAIFVGEEVVISLTCYKMLHLDAFT